MSTLDPIALALALEQDLAALNEARLSGAGVPPRQFVELEEALEAALEVELDAHSTILTQLVELTAWLAAFIRGAA